MTTALLISIFITVSLWTHCMYFRKRGQLPYVHGFDIFSQMQWLACGIGLVHSFGWLWGFIALLFTFLLLQFFTRFTLGLLYLKVFRDDPKPPLALFAIMVFVTFGLSGAHLIWGHRVIWS